MPVKTIRQAINEALDLEMARDPRVVLIGEDISGGAGTRRRDAPGGVMGVTGGLIGKYGEARVIDAPISETAIIGAAVGAAATGLRPIAELMFVDFMGVCFDQILNQAAKLRFMTGGQAKLPLVIRTTIGAGDRSAAQHSQSLYHMFTSVPGLKCVLPATAYDAKGLMIEAIRDDDPVVVFEHKTMYDSQSEVPDDAYSVPFGKARIIRKGFDATVVAFSAMVDVAIEAADTLAAAGAFVEVIDPRTTSPLDAEAILASVEKTRRLIVVDESASRCGLAADIAALVASRGFASLRAPVAMVTPPHTPVPFAPALEDAWLPSAQQVTAAVKALLRR